VDVVEDDDYSSQLRSLRLILGKNFKPISTATLAARAHLELVGVRGVEAGRRQLNFVDMAKIDFYLGALWNPNSHQWVCSWNLDVPFDRLEHEGYISRLESDLAQSNQVPFLEALECLLAALSPKEANVTMFKLHRELLEIAKQNSVAPDIIEEIERCRPILDSKRDTFPVKITTTPEKKRKAKH